MKILQVNLGRAKVAHDLAFAMVMEKEYDLLVVAEPNRAVSARAGWIADLDRDVAIYVRNRNCGIGKTTSSHGYVSLCLGEVTIVACYISPNVPLEVYRRRVDDIMSYAGSVPGPIIMGDLNAKSPLWGSPVVDARGEYWSEWMAERDFTALNTGEPTFVRGGSATHIDVTMAHPSVMRKVANWRVLEEVLFTCHRYISFEIKMTVKRSHQRRRRVEYDSTRFSRLLLDGNAESCQTIDELVRLLRRTMRAARRPSARGGTYTVPYWWTDEIESTRRRCIRAKRMLERMQRRQRGAVDVPLLEEYRALKRELNRLINRSKRSCWSELCRRLDENVWGDAYGIVRRELGMASPYDPDEHRRMEVARSLFPEREIVEFERMETGQIEDFTEGELMEAASEIKTGKAPGPDGVTPEVIRAAVHSIPDVIRGILNGLLRAQVFPDRLKRAKLTLIRKPGKPEEEPSSYRPICLLDCIGKLYERLVLRRLNEEIVRVGGLSELQFGFRKGKSAVQAAEWVKERVRISRCKWVALVALDVKNAFNAASWRMIVERMIELRMAGYLVNLVIDYLKNRVLEVNKGQEVRLSAGVPQGSVLGPTLWNLMYDGVLRTRLPAGVIGVAYADDLVLVIEADTPGQTSYLGNIALQRVQRWMSERSLELAEAKTNAVVLKGPRDRAGVSFLLGGTRVLPSRNMKYLGVVFDDRMWFTAHVREVARKAEERAEALRRLMPNVGGPGFLKRKLLMSVVHSTLLYGAPVWHEALRFQKYRDVLLGVQRRTLLRVACAYRTVSTVALQVIASVIPVHLMVEERVQMHGRTDIVCLRERADIVHREMVREWQNEWSSETVKGRWTRRLIPDVVVWSGCKHVRSGYHFSQFLSGHGSFRAYTFRIGKSEDEVCIYCGNGVVDDAEHTVFQCGRFENMRNRMNAIVGEVITPETFLGVVTTSEENYKGVYDTVCEIMGIKEREERERQGLR